MSYSPYTPVDPDGLVGDLNESQREAVTHAGSPLLVVAGAGTGKTRVLTRRVAWLVAQGIQPWRILAITFTNKAADELRRRLEQLPGGTDVWAGTFHRFGSFLLRRHGNEIGIDTGFTILDRDDQLSILKAIYKDLDLDTGVLRPVDCLAGISHRKNGGGGRAPVDLTMQGVAATFDAAYDSYVRRLRGADLLDFDDLLLDALRLLQECEHVAEQYRSRFAHVLVDEYQDTNLVQRDLLMEVVGENGLITVVGDPDQSIYRWRGAAVRNILDFDDHFPGTHTVLLERNYRSTAHILAAAEAVIERNSERHAKRLYTEQAGGKLVHVTRARDGEDEGRIVAHRVAEWQEAGRRLDHIAIFYRVNAMSRGIEIALNQSGIPYVVVAGTEFFQRREVKDVLAYARLVSNPKDEAALMRVVNTPRRGVGAASLRKLRDFADDHGLALGEAARRAGEAGISKRAANGIERFLALIDRARAMPPAPVAPILEALLEGSGYRASLEDSPDDLDRSRLENVDELVAYAREFAKRNPEGDLAAFLERTALVSDQDGYEPGTGRVMLMSVHAAKGLEFPCVLIAGAELGYFPHGRNLGDPASEEEERRLFYVAMTRAKEELAITHAARRTTYMGDEPRVASPYLGDIPGDSLDSEDHAAWGAPVAWGRSSAGSASFDFDAPADPFPADDLPPGDMPGEDVVRDAGGIGLEVGERVIHPYFGMGRLESVGGGGEDTRVTVDFDTHGVKQLLLRHARLEKLT
ncbi:MAG: UvrD-helicase domain-containing protein [Planctomycetota bacterium]|nr:UvrD-helicase domain-containing protein [Planctomycetota bacterium]